MRPGTFSKMEESVGTDIQTVFEKSAIEAHQEEIAWAKSNNQVFRGLPYIRVMVDGGWGKQSHGHSYDSKTGRQTIMFPVC